MGVLLVVAAIVTALLGSQLHTHIAVQAQRAICKITGSTACDEPGVPNGADSDHTPGEPDRNAYDAECKDDLLRPAGPRRGYRALTEKLEPDSGFEDFRTASLDVARELWGEDSPEFTGTNESFAAVGLDGPWEAPEVEGC